ncbi:hypothetical protein ACWEFL_15705 [Streptomyces sp. NPDC004838]
MAFRAGQTLKAGQLDRMQPVPYAAEASGSLTATTTYQTIPGLSVSLTTKAANARYSAVGVFDCSVTTVHAANLMVGRLTVDTVGQSGFAIHAMDTLDRDTVAMLWSGTLAAAGAHTLTMQGVINGAGGAGSFAQYSRLDITITEVV